MNKLNISKITLNNLYTNKKLSSIKIGEILNYSSRTILNKLRKYSISVRSRGETQKGAKLSKKLKLKMSERRSGLTIEDKELLNKGFQKCSKCLVIKKLDEFYARNSQKYRRECKECFLLQHKKYIEKKKRKNPQLFYIKRKKIRERWNKNHPGKHAFQAKKWKNENLEKIKETMRKAYVKIMSTSKGKLNHSMSTAINTSLKGNKNGRHWEDLVGYKLQDLKQHLEFQFKPKMSWNNYGEWHIDHIKPKSLFNFEKPEDKEFKECWSLKNLQPLWETTRIINGIKYIGNLNKRNKIFIK